ncbi:hypothetical protein [Fervidobacterium thailandense]|uniref:Uncharacterized protein n=1 Tax=Fervidobacterium thailandense TaxID=1008305 RepID=A0A1E3G4S2_9BACT|nr:hypothetical protein [Fervidobacterium thailandense]ODN30833.1 hypothetical protein A4H02_02895 [Fervidobacterium thailandense]
MSKVRKFMTKWQEVFIWVVAIAFVAGIALWALAVNYSPASRSGVKRTIEEAIGYVTVEGTPVKNEKYWVFPEEVEEYYGNLLAMYGNPQLDTAVEVPYVKTLILVDKLNKKLLSYYAEVEKITADKKKVEEELRKEIDEVKKDQNKLQQIKREYGSLSKYEKVKKQEITEKLILETAKDKVAAVTEELLKKEYQKKKNEIIEKYTKAEVKYVTFSKKEELDNFIKLAMEKGFTDAASELKLTPTDYTLKKGTFPEEIEKEIFEATSSLVSIPYQDTYYVFNVIKVEKADTYDVFKQNSGYSEWYEEFRNQRFADNFKKWREKNKVDFEISDPVYKAWYLALITEEGKLIDVYKKFYERFFDEKDKVKTNIPYEEKAAFLVLADRILASTDTTLEHVKEDVKNFEKKIVLSIYNQIKGSSREILRRMKEYYPAKKDIAFQYYSKLYDDIKPYLSVGGAFYVMNQLFEVYQGFGELAEATDVSIDIRADSLYKLYEMNKLLDDPKTAKGYLQKLKALKPDYKINFESAEKELDEMIKSKETKESTSTTNGATPTTETSESTKTESNAQK